MKLNKKKIQGMSAEEAKDLLEKINKNDVDPGSIELSSASKSILWKAVDNSKEQIDEILESNKDIE